VISTGEIVIPGRGVAVGLGVDGGGVEGGEVGPGGLGVAVGPPHPLAGAQPIRELTWYPSV